LKNIVDFHGRPLLVWTHDAALEYGGFSRVLVSTEDPVIMAAIAPLGIDVPFPRMARYDAITGAGQATALAVEQAEAFFGEHYDTVVQLMPTCPLRSARDIADALDFYASHDSEFQVSCVPLTTLNPWTALALDGAGRPTYMPGREAWFVNANRPVLHQVTGAIWIASRDGLARHGSFHGPDLRLCPTSMVSGVDIDTMEELAMASSLFSQRRTGGVE
jgi:CMP-N-acetylneuraminic acid synthetase